MNAIPTGIYIIWLAAASLLSPLQGTGILIVEQETRDGKVATNRIQIDQNHLRAESGAAGQQQVVTFDGQQQVARMIQMDKKTYSEITKQEADAIGNQVNQALAGLPPDQRALAEQLLRGRGGPPTQQAPTVQYRQTGTDKVGQWTCTKYEGYMGNQKTSELCTVEPGILAVSAADFDVTRKMAEFMKSLMPQIADQMIVVGNAGPQGFSGIPVRRTTFQNGKATTVSEVQELRRETFPASTFDVPAGFKKEEFGGR